MMAPYLVLLICFTIWSNFMIEPYPDAVEEKRDDVTLRCILVGILIILLSIEQLFIEYL